MISLAVDGADRALAKLESLPDRLQARLRETVARLTGDTRDRVTAKLNGGVLQRRTGRLMGAVSAAMAEEGTTLAGTIEVDSGAAPYAAIQEYGGETRAHAILPRTARVLVFQRGGATVFARRVNHPGSKIPERSFLRSALAELQPEIQSALRDAISESVAS